MADQPTQASTDQNADRVHHPDTAKAKTFTAQRNAEFPGAAEYFYGYSCL
jgi:hypothetical protein